MLTVSEHPETLDQIQQTIQKDHSEVAWTLR